MPTNDSVVSQSEGISDVKVEDDAMWTAEMDRQLAEIYVYNQKLAEIPRLMQGKHAGLSHWTLEMFLRRFTKLVKKAIRKVQTESQCAEDPTRPVLNKLSKEQIKRVTRSIRAESVRIKLLSYYLLDQPNLELLYLVVEHTNNVLADPTGPEPQDVEVKPEVPAVEDNSVDLGFFSHEGGLHTGLSDLGELGEEL